MITSSLNKRITIQKGVDKSSNYDSSYLEFTDYIKPYANVYVRSGVISNTDNGEDILFTTEFTIRYNTLSKAINNEYRILYNNQYYNVIEVIEIEPKHAIKIIGKHYGV